MDFFPFRPYYYPQNRYMPYNGMQGRRINQAYQGQSKERKSTSYEEEQRRKDFEKQNCSNDRKIENNMTYQDKFETPIFEIFGLKLFFDDVLIISLIFFLYNEGVRDNFLFMSLILILLS